MKINYMKINRELLIQMKLQYKVHTPGLKRYFVVLSHKVIYQHITCWRNTEDMVNTLVDLYKDTLVKNCYGHYSPANIRIVRIDDDGPAIVHGDMHRLRNKIPITGNRKLIVLRNVA